MGPHETEITGLTAHSAAVRPGFLFAALPGSAAHGGDYIDEACAAGANVILSDRETRMRARARTAISETSEPVWIEDKNPRARLAELAARFYAPLPARLVGVTGTDGKTSVAFWTRALLEAAGAEKAAYLGTLGVLPSDGAPPALTTPDPVSLAEILARVKRRGMDRVALEASSHGLAQRRLDGLRFMAACFTGLGRDHADYHKTQDAYLAAKTRLFRELMQTHGMVVLAAGREGSEVLVANLRTHRPDLQILRYAAVARPGMSAPDPAPDYAVTEFTHEASPSRRGTRVRFILGDQEITLNLSLFAPFQAENLLASALLAAALDGKARASKMETRKSVADLLRHARHIPPVPGRLEYLPFPPAHRFAECEIFVDYAHTPQAIAASLRSLRARLDSLGTGRLVATLGAGGARDPGKRPQMGAAAARFADLVIVTDDNPRNENPADIRTSVLRGAAAEAKTSGAQILEETQGRRAAIARALELLKAGDCLAVLGKGHETTQEVAGRFQPFDDRSVIREEARA